MVFKKEGEPSRMKKTRSSSLLRLINTTSPSPGSSPNSESGNDNDESESESEPDLLSSASSSNPFVRFSNKLYHKQSVPALIPVPDISDKPNANVGEPNIFKKMISRKALIPKLKAFKRISDELQIESSPLDDEIHHELMITSAFKVKDDDKVQNSFLFSNTYKNSNFFLQHDNQKRFELINKANEAWNKNRRVSTSSLESSKTIKSISRRGSLTGLNRLASNGTSTKLRQKRRLYDNDDCSFADDNCHDQESDDAINVNYKRRLISISNSNSPILDSTTSLIDLPLSRRNSVLLPSIYSASEELEMMHLR